jgi:hypothetical protein
LKVLVGNNFGFGTITVTTGLHVSTVTTTTLTSGDRSSRDNAVRGSRGSGQWCGTVASVSQCKSTIFTKRLRNSLAVQLDLIPGWRNDLKTGQE